MILAVDIGNTHVCVGILEGLETKQMYRLQTNTGRTDMEYAALLQQMLFLSGMKDVRYDGAIISSVVPQLTGVMKSAVRLVTGCDAMVVGPGIKTGLNIRIDDPKLKQVDRLAIFMGNEGQGLAESTIQAVDHVAKIPMMNGVDSLNVAVAAGLAMWELGRRS